MAVYLQHVYEDVVDEIGIGTGSKKLNQKFPRATNRALSELENKADTGTDFLFVTKINDTITQLADKHEYIIYSGIMYWLMRMGMRPGDPRIATAVLNDTERAWKAAIGDYIKDKVNDDQAEGDNDIAYLGNVS